MDTQTPPVPTVETESPPQIVHVPRAVGGIPAHTVLMAQLMCAVLVVLPILGYNIWSEGKSLLLMERQFVSSLTTALASHQLTLTTSTKSLLLSMSRAPVMYSGNSSTIHSYLRQVGADMPNYDAILVFTPQGHVLAGIKNGKPLLVSSQTVRSRDYFRDALLNDGFVVNSSLLLDNGNTVLPMTMPVRKPGTHEPVAYLMAAVSMSEQALIMQSMASDADSTIALFDAKFTPLSVTSRAKSSSNAAAALSEQNIQHLLGDKAFNFSEESHRPKQTFSIKSPSGMAFVGSAAALGLSQENPYLYIVVLNRQPTWQEFISQRYIWLIAIMLGVSLLGLYVSARVGKFYFADGLTRMAAVAEHIRSGDLTERCGAISGCREIQVASAGFDLMLSVLERNTAELYQLSLMDPLTGLWNRRHFGEVAKQELEAAARNRYSVTVAMADIDHFKHVNDTYGHSIGDVVLQQFSRILRGNIRGSDLLARYGGEEFIFLLPNTDATGAHVLLEKLRTLTESLVVAAPDGREIRFTASFGATTTLSYTTPIEVQLAGLNAKADAALYMAKTAGRNQVIII